MIWQACEGEKHIKPIAGRLFRLVESQEQVATLSYVDTLEEQALLEELLETAKPNYREANAQYHYLLKTPFRYPPLKWGSRFGRVYEPSLFYGGATPEVALAEAAFYRFVFWYSIAAAPIKPAIHSEHTMFSVRYSTDKGIQLQREPFDKYSSQLRHLSDYSSTQALGTEMRQTGVEAFEFSSARDSLAQTCIALFTIKALAQKKPNNLEAWLCEVTAAEVAFKPVSGSEVTRLRFEDFCVDGVLPEPA